MSKLSIGFIGGGNMGSAMVAGLEKKHNILISEPNADSVRRLSALFPSATVVSDNMELINNTSLDVLVLAVKPQILKAVLEPLASKLASKNLLILSIVAGIQIKDICKWSGCNSIVRVMPNTPALLNQGASGLFASEQVSNQQKKWAFEVMESISKKTFWLEQESLIGNL
jgi:pyrroline-5-carboxylate reductase